MEKKSVCSWSGGKDSCYAMMKGADQGFRTRVLLNMLNEEGKISRSHGIPSEILMAQADAAGLPIHLTSSSWADYEKNFIGALLTLKEKYDLGYAVFGDIDLQAHRDWEEKVCEVSGLQAILPVWQMDRKQLVLDMLDAGIKTMIVSCNETLGQGYIGRMITRDIITEFEALGVDPCGENGEYHTLVLDCPLFCEAIQVQLVETLWHQKYWFARLSLQQKR
jgi:uncharacterized protein (TIGR00290 family)